MERTKERRTVWTIDDLNNIDESEIGDVVRQLVDDAILELTNDDLHNSGSQLTNAELDRMRAAARSRLRTNKNGRQ